MPKGAISGIINIAFLAISIGTGVFVVRETQNIQSDASTSNITTLNLSTNETYYGSGERFAVSLKLDSSNNPVGFINTIIKYDPQSLEAIDITPGDYFDNQLVLESTINHKSGQARFTVENAPGTIPQIGSGIVGFLVLKAIKPGTTNMSVESNSQVSANRNQPNQLESFNSLTISIK